MTLKRYLKVEFHDTDFGSVVQEAVERVSSNIHENNAHCLATDPKDKHFSSRTIADIFIALHKVGALQTMLERAVDAIDHLSDVEYATRGLYWKSVDWKGKIVSKKFTGLTKRYLNLTLAFKEKLSDEWEYGEVVWLDMDTGAVLGR